MQSLYNNTVDSPGVGSLKRIDNSRTGAADYLFLDVNSTFTTLIGYRKEELLDKTVSELPGIWQQYKEECLALFSSVLASGRSRELTQWVGSIRKDLTILVIPTGKESLLLLLREAEEEYISFARDGKTSRMEALDAVFYSSHDAVSLLEYRDGEYIYVRNNALHRKLTGTTNIKGLRVSELVGKTSGEWLRVYYDACRNTGHPAVCEQKYDFAPGQRIWHTEITPIFVRGEVRYLLCFSQDITDLKKAENENRKLTARLQAMFNQHGALKLIFDAHSGEIVDVNPAACEFYGYTREELLGMRIGELIMLPPERLEDSFHDELRGSNYFSAVPYRLKNGKMRLLDVYSCPIREGKNVLLYDICFDVTDREHYRNELMKEKEMLRVTLRSIGDGVVTTDNDGRITAMNTVAENLTAWREDAAIGRPFADVFVLRNELTGDPAQNPIAQVLDTGEIVALANHTELIDFHGKSISIADSASPIRTTDGTSLGVVMVFRDVSHESEHRKQIEFLSYHDPLTRLYNRHYIDSRMGVLDTPDNLPIAVIMGDVNGLKITNDVFGHKAGDRLLQNVADLLRENCGPDDLITRWGGDEFVVFMPRTTLKKAEQVIQNIQNTHIATDGGLRLSLSLGCAVKTKGKKSLQAVLREAEEYMYHRKLLEGKSYRNAIIGTLLATLYEKSNMAEEHSQRLEKHAHGIGRRLQLSAKEMDDLSLLALLHDIGKVGIHLDLLTKPGPLTAEEWEEMKLHPEIGYRIAQATPELAVMADLILAHHERWDGAGYPHGLKGEDIPLVCRIIAVADAFDAMTSERAYRKAMCIEDAVAEIEQNAGTQFDPTIAAIFVDYIRGGN